MTLTMRPWLLDQERLGLAIDFVGVSGQVESGVEIHRAHFPWACNHMTDRTVPGGPFSEAEIIANYWMDLWDELHGEDLDLEVLASFPGEGGREHHQAADEVESRLTVVFNRSLLQSEVGLRRHCSEGDGELPSLEPWLFYRDDSHVLHFEPSDWSADSSDYTLTLAQGLEGTDGRTLPQDFVLNFSTKPSRTLVRTQGGAAVQSASASGGLGLLAVLAPLAKTRGAASPKPSVRMTQLSSLNHMATGM